MSEHIIHASYQFTQTLSSANTARLIGPKGKIGTIKSIDILCTTGLTGTAGLLSIGVSGDAARFATHTLPNTSASERVDGLETINRVNGLQTRIGPDDVVELTNTADPTAGAGIIFINIDWE